VTRYGGVILRGALGVVFFWFGALMFFPSLGPAQTLAVATIDALASASCPGTPASCCSRALECAIGLGPISGRLMRLTPLLLAFRMVGAASPLLLLPGEVFADFP
jgi:hypothetical protein